MARIVWLASYPKSGNTWTRALLAGYYGAGALDLNDLGHVGQPGGLRTLGDLFGVDPGLLRRDEIQAYQPAAARLLANDLARRRGGPAVDFCKLHSANLATPDGDRLYPADAGRAVYIARNPLDVAASTAPFYNWPIDRVVRMMGDEAFVLNGRARGFRQLLPEPLTSWSGHVRSWLDAPGLAVHLVRYEDLHADTEAALAGILRFVGDDPDPDRLAAAVEAARFDRLRAREDQTGFRERPTMAAAPFFRKGRTGSWREELTAEQARRVVADHEDTMRRLGYGDQADEVLGSA